MTITKARTNRLPVSTFVLFGLLALLGLGTMTVAATGPLTNITIEMGRNLGISQDNAGLLLSVGILVSITMCLALLGGRKMSPVVMFVPNVSAMAFLVSIGWLPFWVLLVLAVLLAYMFAGPMKTMLGG